MDTLLTAQEVAAWARLSKWSVMRLARLGKIHGRKLGGEWRFTIDAVRSWSGFSDVTVEDIRRAAESAEAVA